MTDTEQAVAEAKKASDALGAIGKALTEMNKANTQGEIDLAHAIVEPARTAAVAAAAAALTWSITANTAEADDAADRARDDAGKAQSAAADATTLLERRKPTLPP